LVATDLDRSSQVALQAAQGLAAAAGASLHVVHVEATPREQGAVIPVRVEPADAVRVVLQEAGVVADEPKIHVLPGDPAETIRLLADRIAADVVVVGPHRKRGSAAADAPLGGTASGVVTGAYAPCLVVTHPLRLPIERVLVPVDLSDTARGALIVGLTWASALRTGPADEQRTVLTALHVDAGVRIASGDSAVQRSIEHELDIVERNAGDWAGVSVQGVTLTGSDPARAISDYALASKADLVVLGSRGLGLDDEERLGSVSAALSTRLRVPILLVPPAVWRAHVAVP
jgi:nucleotide-binding universal stress UspA family protein